MAKDEIMQAFSQALEGRRLLDHPFYQRWQNGEVRRDELTTYAEQYRHIEQVIPELLASVVARLPEGPARRFVQENLHDERQTPRPHTDLFESFAKAVSARPEVAASAATVELVDHYRGAANQDPVAALSFLAAYELQAAEIASTKGDGLRAHYGLDESQTEFWDVHAELESDHGAWSVEALNSLCADAADVYRSARDAAEKWWGFLDERELSACV